MEVEHIGRTTIVDELPPNGKIYNGQLKVTNMGRGAEALHVILYEGDQGIVESWVFL